MTAKRVMLGARAATSAVVAPGLARRCSMIRRRVASETACASASSLPSTVVIM